MKTSSVGTLSESELEKERQRLLYVIYSQVPRAKGIVLRNAIKRLESVLEQIEYSKYTGEESES